jgi:hypothetical protein
MVRFSSFFVSGITVIALVTVFLKSEGYLEHVNTSHIHDLENLCLVLVFSGLIFGFHSLC